MFNHVLYFTVFQKRNRGLYSGMFPLHGGLYPIQCRQGNTHGGIQKHIYNCIFSADALYLITVLCLARSIAIIIIQLIIILQINSAFFFKFKSIHSRALS